MTPLAPLALIVAANLLLWAVEPTASRRATFAVAAAAAAVQTIVSAVNARWMEAILAAGLGLVSIGALYRCLLGGYR